MINSNKIIVSQKNQYVIYSDERFFLSKLSDKNYLIPDKCPHRGGPLSLGSFCKKTGGIECPWHNSVIKPVTLIKRSIPAIRIHNKIFII